MPKQVELTEDQMSTIKDEDLDFLYLLLDPATPAEEKVAALKARSAMPALPAPTIAPGSQRVN